MPVAAFTPTQYRRFGWLLAAVLLVAAWRLGGVALPALGAAAALVFALATVWPRTLRGPHAVLTMLAAPVGWLVSRALLTLVFFGLVVPLGLLFRLLGRDALHCRPDASAATYWQPCDPTTPDYLRQF
jgi:hypothetical protein